LKRVFFGKFKIMELVMRRSNFECRRRFSFENLQSTLIPSEKVNGEGPLEK